MSTTLSFDQVRDVYVPAHQYHFNGNHPRPDLVGNLKIYPEIGRTLTKDDVGRFCVRVHPLKNLCERLHKFQELRDRWSWGFIPPTSSACTEKAKESTLFSSLVNAVGSVFKKEESDYYAERVKRDYSVQVVDVNESTIKVKILSLNTMFTISCVGETRTFINDGNWVSVEEFVKHVRQPHKEKEEKKQASKKAEET